MLALAVMTAAQAADVVWLGAAPDDQRASVLAASGGDEIALIDLRAGPTAVGPDDDEAFDALGAAIESVRSYETQLDGELVIMRDLQPPIDAVGILRNDTDRSALFGALAYQGFAVERYFGDALGDAEDAEPYRATLNGLVVERPWLDAVAIEPDRDVTAYEIAEAPQRIAYAGTKAVVNEVLPASLRPPADDGVLFIDGRQASPGPTGDVKLPPGRHLAHLERAGRVLARWDVRLEPGQQIELEPALTDAVWNDFIDDLAPGAAIPDPVLPVLEAVGGEVWLARPGERRPTVWSVRPEGIREVEIAAQRPATAARSGGPSFHVAVVGGWTGSHDFYYQDPANVPPDGATVNAPTVGLTVGTDLHLGPLRLGVGADGMLPLGEPHVAVTGATTTRLRPVPPAVVGVGPATLAVGYVFPYHPALGGRGAIGLPGPLELRWLGWFGLPTTRTTSDGSTYELRPLGMAAAGIGARL